MRQLKATFKGRVQGVGFRYTILDLAEARHLVGYVKNLPGGDVEMVAQGEELERFIEEIRKNCESAHIQSICTKYSDVDNSYTEFKIEY